MKISKLLYLAIVAIFSVCHPGSRAASAPSKQPTLQGARKHMLRMEVGLCTPFTGSDEFSRKMQELTKREIQENEQSIQQLEQLADLKKQQENERTIAALKQQRDVLHLTVAAQALTQVAQAPMAPQAPQARPDETQNLYNCGYLGCSKSFNDRSEALKCYWKHVSTMTDEEKKAIALKQIAGAPLATSSTGKKRLHPSDMSCLYYCGECGQGFNDYRARNNHYAICPKTPKRQKTGN
jgi:hypothetical protein